VSVATLAVVVTCAAVGLVYLVARAVARLVCVPPDRDATVLFARGIGPTMTAVAFALGVVLPAFLLFEPPHDGERAGVVLLALAAVGAVHLVQIAVRALRMIGLSRALTERWLATATPLTHEPWGIATFAIDAGFPVVAVGGLLRPRLFVDRQVLAACSPDELEAIAAHERAHVLRRDNLRRLLIGACDGPMGAAASAWREAAERAADADAASSPRRAVDLASALLKLARVAPTRTLECTVLSTIHDGGLLETRVRHLVSLTCTAPAQAQPPRAALLVLLPAAVAIGLNFPALLRSAHALTEAAVRHLP
jgi:hypothetical protein